MVTQRRLLRLLDCLGCHHLRASHYLVIPYGTGTRPHFSRPREQTTPMPCHVLRCECARFSADSTSISCPFCSRTYTGRSSLEIHFYGHHPGLSLRERSESLRSAIYPRGRVDKSFVDTDAPHSATDVPAEV